MDINEYKKLSLQLKQQTKTIRKREYKKRISVFDEHAQTIITLYRIGNSRSEILRYLKTKKLNISHQALTNWLKRNGEIQ